MRLRVAFLTPFASPSSGGNAVTVGRIASGLRERDVDCAVWDLSATSESDVAREVEAFRPSLVHALHAFHAGPLALCCARRLDVPLVATLTGTDANHDLFDPRRAPVVRRVLEGAARLVAFDASIAARVVAELPDLRERFAIVAQAVSLAQGEPFDVAARWPQSTSCVLFLFAGGIRGVKRPRLPLSPFDALVARRPQVCLLYVGPILDPDEGEALRHALARRPWARHLGAVPHSQMGSLLAQSDVVLNCSISEGGMPNAVLEALALGRAVLASDIEGNRALVEDGVTGLLFRDEAELLAQAERLTVDPELRARLGASGRALVERAYTPEREIEGYLDVYRSLNPVPVT